MSATLLKVLGDTCFPEVGDPIHVVETGSGVVVAGFQTGGALVGRELEQRDDDTGSPLAVYAPDDARCVLLTTTPGVAHAAALHPDGDLVALGTGQVGPDGDTGQLVLVDVVARSVVHLLSSPRQLAELRWLDSRSLEVLVAPEGHDGGAADCRRVVLERPDWRAVAPRSVHVDVERGEVVEAHEPGGRILQDMALSRARLAELAANVGRSWELRRCVVDLEPAPDAGVLATLRHVAAERWGPDGERLWQHRSDGLGAQLVVLGDELVLCNALGDVDTDGPGEVLLLDARSGLVRETVHRGDDVVLTGGSACGALLRSTARTPPAARLLDTEGRDVDTVELGALSLYEPQLDVRRADEHLLVARQRKGPHVGVLRSRRLRSGLRFEPLYAYGEPGAEVDGGVGVRVDDARGSALIHSGHALLDLELAPGGAFVQRRDHPAGDVVWRVELDAAVAGLDELDGQVLVATWSGELLALEAATGRVAWRQRLTVADLPVQPMALCLAADATAYVGLRDGRILHLDLGWTAVRG